MNFKRIYIEITNVCNLSCSFCSPLKREKRFMSLGEFEHILREISPFKPHIYLHIKGEPLIHPEIEGFLRLAEKHKLPVNLTTNGTLISKHTDLILKHTRQVNISVHSLNDNQISDKEEYISSICNLGKKAKELKAPYISYRMWNGDENGGIDEDALSTLRLIGESFGVSIDKEIKKGRDAKKLADNVYISFMDEFEWPSLNHKFVKDRGKCLGGVSMLGILCDGTVVPCCLDADGIINMGNIFNESLKSIINKEKFRKLSSGFSGGKISEELCQKCSYRTRFDKE